MFPPSGFHAYPVVQDSFVYPITCRTFTANSPDRSLKGGHAGAVKLLYGEE